MSRFKYSTKCRFRLTNPDLLQEVFNDSGLSLKAKGLFSLIGQTPTEEWTIPELTEKCRDTEHSIKSALHELEHFQLIRVREIRKLTYAEIKGLI